MNSRIVGAGVAVAIAAGLGYALLSDDDDEAEFELLVREGAFSIRDYPRLIVAETAQHGLRESALSRGFLTLSDYVFGKDRAGTRIPILAPVFADGDDDRGGWRTRFVMPLHLSEADLPAPGEGVALRRLPARRVASLRFTGDTGDREIEQREVELRRWIVAKGHRIAGPVEHAYYSSPFMPGPLRHTEVLFPLAT